MDILTKSAISATLHCLTGCAIGEILGLVLGTVFGWTIAVTIIISIILAFFFGYLLTITPVLKSGVAFASAVKITIAADTASITTMEVVDNVILLFIPGALTAGLASGLFWGSLALSLFIAFWVTVPINRYLIKRGRGHAVVHQFHAHDSPDPANHEHMHHH